MDLSVDQVWGFEDDKNSLTQYKWDTLPDFISNGKKGFMTARELMQVFSTDIMRNMFNEDIWANNVLNQIHRDNYDFAIIDDLRFRTEIRALLKYNSFFIRLTRQAGSWDAHVSENDLDSYDWTLNLNSSQYIFVSDHLNIEETWKKTRNAIEALL